MAQPVAGETRVGVGGVLSPIQTAALEIFQHFAARHIQHRPENALAIDGPNAAQSAATCASQESEKHSLGLIGLRVTGGDFRTGTAREELLEETVAGSPAGPLEVAARQGHVLSAHEVLAAELDRELTYELFVGIRVGASQAVIQMQYRNLTIRK